MFSGLRAQILFLTLLPPLLIAFALGSYLSYSRIQDLDNFSHLRGSSLILQLSINAQAAFANNDIALLQKLSNAALEENGIRSISFFTKEGKELTHSGPTFKTPLPKNFYNIFSQQRISNDNHLLFISPIFKERFTSDITHSIEDSKKTIIALIAVEYNQDSIIIQKHYHIFIQNILIVLALIISGLIGYKISQRMITDLKNVSNSIKRIKEGDAISLKDVSSSTEIKILAKNLDEMANHLKNEFDEMRHNVEISTNDLKETIETIEIQNIELNLAKKEALTASKTKSEFLANTSHEIRTPLNGIIGFTKILKKTPLNKHQQEYVDTIQLSSENLLAIINDILDFSKIEAGKLELEIVPFNIRHLMEECISLFAPHAYEKNIEVVLMIYQDVPLHIMGDSLRIKQIISNLLSNAIKFTQKGTIAIRIALEHINNDDIELSISVSDTGIGMTALQQKNIFNAFTQANSSVSREYGGTGLGLAIVKKLVELMNDDIRVESAPNEGSTFSFVLKTKIDTQENHSNYNHLQKKSILLIEKHALLSLSIKHLLSNWGIKTLEASSIDKALALLTEHHIDIIIYDPNINGDPKISAKEIDELSKQSKPMLLLMPSANEKRFQSLKQKNISINYKPVIEARLYHSLYDITFPQKALHPSLIQITSQRKQGLNVLAVDDHPANLKLLNILLEDLDIAISNATDGKEAIELADSRKFDLILMDIQMPIINGLNATKIIREKSTLNKKTPIVAITAHAMADEKEAIFKSGMDDYIAKPINEEQLSMIINKWCDSKSAEPNMFIDLQLCLKLANYKHDLAIDMFTMLLKSLPHEIANIEKSLNEKDHDALLELVHKLHGACCYTGLPELKSSTQSFEYAIKSNIQDQYLSLFAQLKKAVENILHWDQENNFTQELISIK
jgi:two-component system sensor histidine kinase BarA